MLTRTGASKRVKIRPRRTIGVLGGMGPEATAYFFDLIVKNTRAVRDQDHMPVIVYNLPQIPDRTTAILERGPSPLPAIVRGLETLESARADFAVIPCITAHHFLSGLPARSPLPLVNLVAKTVAEFRHRFPRLKKLGLLATTGTVRSRLLHKAFAAAGIEILVPAPGAQKQLMTAIYGKRGIKTGVASGTSRMIVLEVAAGLTRRGAQAIMAGCTEIPLVLRAEDLAVPLIEPMLIAARACIKRAGGEVR